MKRITLLLTLTIMTVFANAQTPEDYHRLQLAVESYVQAGDSHDLETLHQLLNSSYRVTMNNQQAGQVMTFSRADYLAKIKSKEWGGDNRTLEILSIDVYDGSTAVVKVALNGKLKMRNYLSFVNTAQGWQIAQDLVFVGS